MVEIEGSKKGITKMFGETPWKTPTWTEIEMGG
jgi:hypothetical protein